MTPPPSDVDREALRALRLCAENFFSLPHRSQYDVEGLTAILVMLVNETRDEDAAICDEYDESEADGGCGALIRARRVTP